VTFILQPEIPHVTLPYIDDVTVKGPADQYKVAVGGWEMIPANPGVRRYFWEHLPDVNRCVQRVKHAGGTFSGTKANIGPPEFAAIGHFCTPEGRKPDVKRTEAIANWGPCKDLSEVRAFLGTVG
ncbi:hypothetical protein OH76DRAFT_1301184, partial [Lentinus brumalis]